MLLAFSHYYVRVGTRYLKITQKGLGWLGKQSVAIEWVGMSEAQPFDSVADADKWIKKFGLVDADILKIDDHV